MGKPFFSINEKISGFYFRELGLRIVLWGDFPNFRKPRVRYFERASNTSRIFGSRVSFHLLPIGRKVGVISVSVFNFGLKIKNKVGKSVSRKWGVKKSLENPKNFQESLTKILQLFKNPLI